MGSQEISIQKKDEDQGNVGKYNEGDFEKEGNELERSKIIGEN